MDLLNKVKKRFSTGKTPEKSLEERQQENSPPPPYDEQTLSSDMLAIEEQWDKRWRSTTKADITFRFLPISHDAKHNRIKMTRESKAEWTAVLAVTSKNIPRLLRKGLYWSSANLQMGSSRMFYTRPAKLNTYNFNQKWTRARTFCLKDPEGEWTADLIVAVSDGLTPGDFDLDRNWLSVDNTWRVSAWDWKGEQVYSYHALDNGLCFNAINGHMPMKGWLPQPRASEEQPQIVRK